MAEGQGRLQRGRETPAVEQQRRMSSWRWAWCHVEGRQPWTSILPDHLALHSERGGRATCCTWTAGTPEGWDPTTLSKIALWDFPGGLVVQLCTSTAGGAGLIPGQGTKIPHAMRCGQKFKKKKESKDSVESCLCSWHLAPGAWLLD